MTKREFGPQPWIIPHPTILIGTVYEGRVDFATFVWCGVAGGEPPAVSIGIQHQRHTLKGIMQHRTFSVNIPSTDLVAATDYCGLVSGARADKATDCGFKVFYGTLDTAPLIEQCPVNLECKVMHLLDIGIHMLVIGKVVQTHVTEDCLTDGQPDIMKIKPFVSSRGTTAQYNAIGELVGQAFNIGKSLKKE